LTFRVVARATTAPRDADGDARRRAAPSKTRDATATRRRRDGDATATRRRRRARGVDDRTAARGAGARAADARRRTTRDDDVDGARATHARGRARAMTRDGANADASTHGTLAYGLNLPKKTTAPARGRTRAAPRPTLAAFARDSDDDASDDDDDDPVKARARANAEVKRQQEAMALKARRDAARAATTTREALAEDANAFEYDAVFDDIEKSRGAKAKETASERVERKSRYIGDLIAKAETRKKEEDASYERRLLKERLKEDHLYADKDKFVTAAYRAKLQEDAKWLAEDKARDAVEEEEDVAKRGAGAMTSFYSNLMHRNSAMGGDAAKPTRRAAPEPKASNATTASNLTSAADRDRELIARASAAETPAIPPIPDDVTLVEKPTKVSKAISAEAAPTVKSDLNQRRNTDADVSDARARYLERKRKAAGGAS